MGFEIPQIFNANSGSHEPFRFHYRAINMHENVALYSAWNGKVSIQARKYGGQWAIE